MQLFRFYLPKFDNDGISTHYAHDAFRRYLLAEAGGYTNFGTVHVSSRDKNGAWLNNTGQEMVDELTVYEVAFNGIVTQRESTEAYECAKAVAMGLFSDQHAIFSANVGIAEITNRNNNTEG